MTSLEKGQIALPFVLLISGIIIEIVIAGAFVAYFASGSGYSARLQARAWAVAMSGVNDALMKIARNKEFAPTEVQYEFTLDADGAAVTASRTTDITGQYYLYTVTSLGSAGSRQKKLTATAVVHQVTGALQLQSLVDVPLQ